MKKNTGSADKYIRIVLALILTIIYFLDVVVGNIALLLIAAALILFSTAVLRTCPLYWIFNLNTTKHK